MWLDEGGSCMFRRIGRDGGGFICCRRNTEFGSGDSVIEVYVPVLGLVNDRTSLPHSEHFSWMWRD